MLRKAQKSEKQEWRRIRDEIARETTEHIEHKLRTAVEHLLGTGKQLSERARIDEIAEQPANEVVQHVFMYLSHRDMFPADVNEAMRRFFGYVSANQFASKLFKLAICRGTIEDPEQAQAEYVEDGEDDAEESEEDEEQNENNESNKEYDVDWDRKHHRQVVPEGERVYSCNFLVSYQFDLQTSLLPKCIVKHGEMYYGPYLVCACCETACVLNNKPIGFTIDVGHNIARSL